MRVLVTGASGFVGGHIARALRLGGHDPVLFVRDPARLPDGLRGHDHRVGDVTDAATVHAALDGCEAVVHAAGVVSFDRRREDEVRRTNVAGATTVLEAAAQRGLDPIVFVSSVSALFPPTGNVLGPDEPVKEAATLYGATKAQAERVARQLQDDGVPIVIVYPGGVYGPDDPHLGEQTRAVVWFLRLAMVPNAGGGYPMVDARDLAAAVAAAVGPARGPRRYMLGGRLLSGPELARAASAVTGRRIVSPPVPGAVLVGMGRAGDAVQRRLPVRLPFTEEGMQSIVHGVPFDNSRAEQELGFRCRPPEDTLRDAVRWLAATGAVPKWQAGRLA